MAKYLVILELETDEGDPTKWDWWDMLQESDIYYLNSISVDDHKDQTSYIKKVIEVITK